MHFRASALSHRRLNRYTFVTYPEKRIYTFPPTRVDLENCIFRFLWAIYTRATSFQVGIGDEVTCLIEKFTEWAFVCVVVKDRGTFDLVLNLSQN